MNLLLKIVAAIARGVRREIGALLMFTVVYFPDDYLGRLLRRLYWKAMLSIGPQFVIERGAKLGPRHLLTVGDHFKFGEYAEIAVGDAEPKQVWIGNYVSIARYTWIRSANHAFGDTTIPIALQGHESRSVSFRGKQYSIVIEDDVWIAPNAVILSGAHIGQGSVIAAGAVVSGPVPPYSVVVGNPGRVAKSRIPKPAGAQPPGDGHAKI